MINYTEFIHPEDAKAQKTLEAIPGFSLFTKKFMEYGLELMYYGTNIASSIRLSPTQLPQIYKHLPPICAKLGIEEPEFYLEMNPMPNAYTFGDTKKFIAVTSGLIESLNDEEITAVIAHECGHIMCRHTLYNSMVMLLSSPDCMQMLPDAIKDAITIGLRYWSRKSELSADRVAALVTSSEVFSRSMVRLAGGPKSITSNLNLQEWAEQADLYNQLYNNEGVWNRTVQMFNTMYNTHPFAAVRVSEVLKWTKSSQYSSLRKRVHDIATRRCCNCGREADFSMTYCQFCGSKI